MDMLRLTDGRGELWAFEREPDGTLVVTVPAHEDTRLEAPYFSDTDAQKLARWITG